MEIREITSKDFNDWKALYLEYSKNLNNEQIEHLFNWLIDPNENIFCLLATQDQKILGLVHYREYIRPLTAAKCLYMDDIFVMPNKRSNGIGSKLLSTLAMRGLKAGYSHLEWASQKENARANKLYEKLGQKKPLNLYEISFG